MASLVGIEPTPLDVMEYYIGLEPMTSRLKGEVTNFAASQLNINLYTIISENTKASYV